MISNGHLNPGLLPWCDQISYGSPSKFTQGFAALPMAYTNEDMPSQTIST